MRKLKPTTWQAIEGMYATHYVLLMVISTAITIAFTRLYLELTGYPQIGNDTFHIAHALWGGLLQAIAAILMLIYLNRWVFMVSAVLAGMGIGLFVDEIGKFITQSNDYFFPLAAPLIYLIIVLLVVLYLYIHQDDDHDARGSMYLALDNLKPLLDNHMDQQQYNQLKKQLTDLTQQTERQDIAQIAGALLQSLPEDINTLPTSNKGVFERMVDRLQAVEATYFSQAIMRRILITFFLISGTSAILLVSFIGSIVANPENLEEFILSSLVQAESLINNPVSLNWYLAWIVITIVVGMLYFVSSVALILKKDQPATRLGTIGLTIALTIGNTLSFYFNQFSVIFTSFVLFGFLLTVIRYRVRFLQDDSLK